MMTKNKSNRLARLKVLLAAPAVFMLAVIFTTSPVVQTMAQVESKMQQQKNSPTTPPVPPPPPKVDDQKPQSKAPEDVFTVVEEMPQFPGGDEARMKYLMENIKYPEEARKNGIQGTVYVSYVVEKDGSISNVKVLRGIDKECDEVAMNVIKNMPNWIPGKQRGQAVRVQFNMPIRFTLGEKEEKKTE